MKRLLIYADVSVIGGCEDDDFCKESLAIMERFRKGEHILVISEHTLRELIGAPESVRKRLYDIPPEYQMLLPDSNEAFALAEAYIRRKVVSRRLYPDALHVALATVAHVNVLISWNFKHIVNLSAIRLFQAVNLEQGYLPIEIRTPREVLYR
jgi:hypothetical protein